MSQRFSNFSFYSISSFTAIKSLLLVAGLSLALGNQTHADDLQSVHDDISNELSSFIVGIDQFFGDSGAHEDKSDLIIDLEMASLYSRYQKNEHNFKYRAKVRLDNLNKQVQKLGKRIELVIQPNDPLPEGDNDESLMQDQPISSVHIQVADHKAPLFKYQLGHNGFKSLFVGASFDRHWLVKSNRLEWNSALRYTSKEVTQLVIEPSITRRVFADWQQVFFTDYRYQSDLDDQHIGWGGKWRRQFDHRHGLSLAATSQGNTKHDYQSEQYLISATHRFTLYGDWMFLNTQLFNQWQRSRNFSQNYGISLGLNAYFGQ